ncbi:MAG: beta-propeller fold lactonase family protein [Terriglobales bacterium]
MFLAAAIVMLAAQFISCSGNGKLPPTGSGGTAFMTVPDQNYIMILHIDGVTGAVTVEGTTPADNGTSPHGLVLSPNKKFLYVANSQSNDITTYSVAGDGTLSLVCQQTVCATPTGGTTPWEAIIDPSGNYLLVTNVGQSSNVSVFSIDSSSGALAAVPGSPFYANESPSEIAMPAAGNLVYVSNGSSANGTVTAFTFDTATGALAEVQGSPFYSGAGASALAIDNSGQFLYVANTSAINSNTNVIGNISGFNINPTTGVLTPISGSPFAPPIGTGPQTLAVVPNSQLMFATTPGSSYSIWCFTIDSVTGQLAVVNDSPFSQTAGGSFALVDTNGSYFYIGSAQLKGIAAYTFDSNTGQPTAVLNSPFSTQGQIPGKMVIDQ